MNPKIKRIVAIFALVFVCIATVALTVYLFDSKALGGAVEFILFISAALGLGTGIPLILLNSGERKRERRQKLYEDIERAEEEKARAEAEEAERKKLERVELDRKINDENNKK